MDTELKALTSGLLSLPQDMKDPARLPEEGEGMNTDCVNCKHARLWTDKEQFECIERMYKSIGRMPCRADRYICDKIPEGTEWTDDGKTYTYDGYSLDGENYDEVFHCFEPQEREE